MKVITALALSIGFMSAVNAQSANISSAAGGINAPKASVSISPTIGTGIRSQLTGKFANSQENANTVGAYVTPGFELGYKGSLVDFSLAYELEMSAARGFGKAVASENRGITNNSYFYNHPVLSTAIKFNPNIKLNNMTEIAQFMHSDNDAGYRSDKVVSETRTWAITSITDLEYKINSSLSVATGYRMDYEADYGALIGVNRQLAAKKSNKAFAASSRDSDTPSSLMSSSITTAKIKLNDKASLKTYVMVGRNVESSDTESKLYFYRLNNDFTLTSIKDLELALRWRLDYANPQGADKGSVSNTGRVIANYALNKNWTANLTNTLKVSDPIANAGRTGYNNEQYVGVTYKF